jgi:hypothetical protein
MIYNKEKLLKLGGTFTPASRSGSTSWKRPGNRRPFPGAH